MRFLGNFPQVLSHHSHISAAAALGYVSTSSSNVSDRSRHFSHSHGYVQGATGIDRPQDREPE